MDINDNKVNGNKGKIISFEGKQYKQVDLEEVLESKVGCYGFDRCPGDQKSTSYVRRVGNGRQKSIGVLYKA